MTFPDALTAYGQTYIPETTGVVLPRFVGWRGLHKSEGGRETPEGQPCVIPSQTVPPIPFTAAMQILTFGLMRQANPALTENNFRSVFAGDTAFCNGTGWDNSHQPGEVYADYVSGKDIGAELPKLQRAIVCAGSFTTGQVIGDTLVCRPGTDGIDTNRPLPDVETVIRKGWYFAAVIGWTAADRSWRIGYFGTKGIVLIPRFLRQPTEYPAAFFGRWESDYLPDPLKAGG